MLSCYKIDFHAWFLTLCPVALSKYLKVKKEGVPNTLKYGFILDPLTPYFLREVAIYWFAPQPFTFFPFPLYPLSFCFLPSKTWWNTEYGLWWFRARHTIYQHKIVSTSPTKNRKKKEDNLVPCLLSVNSTRNANIAKLCNTFTNTELRGAGPYFPHLINSLL